MRKIAIVTGASALAGLLAACSSSTGGHGTSAPPPSSGGPLNGAQFARQTTHAAEKAQTVAIKETTTLFGEPLTGTGAMRFAGQTAEATFSTHANGLNMQVVMTGGAVYVKGFGSASPGKPWTRSDPAEAADMTTMLRHADPRQTVRMLLAAGTMRPVAQETMNGVATAHYSVQVDLAKVAQQVPELAHEVDEARQAGVRSEDVQVWVGPDQLPVRMITSAAGPDPREPTKKLVTSQTTDYSDWGKPVTITAPPASEVGD